MDSQGNPIRYYTPEGFNEWLGEVGWRFLQQTASPYQARLFSDIFISKHLESQIIEVAEILKRRSEQLEKQRKDGGV